MKIRSLALGSVASVALLATGALAADLPVRSAAPAPVMYAPVFTWTGFYVGVNAGYGGDKVSFNEYETINGVRSTGQYNGSISSSGFLGGVQAGYNFQFGGGFVLGLEADYQWSNIDGRWTNGYQDGSFYWRDQVNSEVTGFGTVRARLGYAAFANRALFYVTGGWAYGSVKNSFSYTGSNCLGGVCDAGSRKSNPNGWTVGAGLEYALTDNFTFKTEYLFVDLGNSSHTYDNGKGFYTRSIDTKFHVVRAGLNYKFGWGSAAAPVVARY